jgi:hypothetical protein
VPRVTPISAKGSENYAQFLERLPPDKQAVIMPKWVQAAVDKGMTLKSFVRADGMGLLAKQDALPIMADFMKKNAAEDLLFNLIYRAESITGNKTLLSLFSHENNYHKHVKKRLDSGDIADEADYQTKTHYVLANSKTITIAQSKTGLTSGKLQIETEGWVVILGSDGKIVTSYPRNLEKTTFEQNYSNFGDHVYEQPISERIRARLKKLFS